MQVTLLVTTFGLLSFFFGTTRDAFLVAWRHYTGAELAHELAPQVQELRSLQTQQAPIIHALEQNVTGLVELKQAEQMRAQEEAAKRDAVETAQRAACLVGDLSPEACARYGYPSAPRK